MVKTMGLRPADIVQQIRQRSEVGTESACDRRRDMYIEQALKEAFTAGFQFSEVAADSQTDQNPPSEQWGGYGYPAFELSGGSCGSSLERLSGGVEV